MAGEGETPPQGGEGGEKGGDGFIKMTQAELNAKMAEHKRGLQKELSEAKSKAAAFDQLQGQVSELLGSGLIDGVEDLAGFREKAGQTLESFKTKEQQLVEEHKKTTKALETAQKTAKEYTERYERATIARAITDEASAKSVSPGATELIQMKLAPLAVVNPDGSVAVNMTVKDDEGKAVAKKISVKEAVEILEADAANFGTLFKSTVNGGAGGQVDGVKKTPEGYVDFNNLSFEKFIELQKKNPDVIQKSLAAMRK